MRDCLHPRDLGQVLIQQIESSPAPNGAITNFSGGKTNSMSLRQLHDWCETRYGSRSVQKEMVDRPFDLPWMILDSSLAEKRFAWKAATPLPAILDEIAQHAKQNPGWLNHTA